MKFAGLLNETGPTLNENAFHSFVVAKQIFLWQLPQLHRCNWQLLVHGLHQDEVLECLTMEETRQVSPNNVEYQLTTTSTPTTLLNHPRSQVEGTSSNDHTEPSSARSLCNPANVQKERKRRVNNRRAGPRGCLSHKRQPHTSLRSSTHWTTPSG